MAVKVTPRIYIDNTLVASTPEAINGGDSSQPVAVRGFNIQWGSDNYVDQTVEPSTLEMELYDCSYQWTSDISEGTAIGKPVRVDYVAALEDGSTRVITMFRGSIRSAKASYSHVKNINGRTAISIMLTCADVTANLGEILSDVNEYPYEDMIVRAGRLNELCKQANTGITDCYVDSDYIYKKCYPIEVKDKNGLELLTMLYETVANNAYYYNPNENYIDHFPRLSYGFDISLGTFDNTRGAVLPFPSDIQIKDYRTYRGTALPGNEIMGEINVEKDVSSSFTTAKVTYKKDWVNGQGVREFLDWWSAVANIPPNQSARVLQWDSYICDEETQKTLTQKVFKRMDLEGRFPVHPPITTQATFTFPTYNMAEWYLQTYASPRPAYISGDNFSYLTNSWSKTYPPVYAPIGGVTSFDALKGWSVSYTLARFHRQNWDYPPVTWGGLQQIKVSTSTPEVPWWYSIMGIPAPPPVSVGEPIPERDLKWGDPDKIDGYAFDKSVTWQDMKFVADKDAQIKDILK